MGVVRDGVAAAGTLGLLALTALTAQPVLTVLVAGAATWLPTRAAAQAPGLPGNAVRGAAIVASRTEGLCLLCHPVPGQPDALQGTLAPPLAGAGARYSAQTLLQRLTAPEMFNPETVMPSYSRTDGLNRVAPALRGKALLSPAQIDDVVAYLVSLK